MEKQGTYNMKSPMRKLLMGEISLYLNSIRKKRINSKSLRTIRFSLYSSHQTLKGWEGDPLF